MKKKFIEKCMKYITKNTNYTDTQLEEIEYGLVGIYLTISKIVVIIALSIALKIFIEVITFLVLFNIIRAFAFGLHATKSWICLISSTLIFIGIPELCLYINIPIIFKVLSGVIGIIFIFKNSPADTKKRPIVSSKRRTFYKFSSTLISIGFAFISIIIDNQFISNCLIFSTLLECILISPLVYRVFNLPYNNYIDFLKKHPDFQTN